MSNLSSNLPPAKPVTQANVNEVFHDLTTEFKNAAKSVASLYSTLVNNTDKDKLKLEFANAAKSVASLYRLTHTSSSLLQHKGYLNCLDDLLNIIAQDGDVENWALTKRAEITYDKKDDVESEASSESSERTEPSESSQRSDSNAEPLDEFNIPSDFEFTFAHETKPYTSFKPSMPLLSVQRPLDKLKKHRILKKLEDSSSESEQDKEDVDFVVKKRKTDDGSF